MRSALRASPTRVLGAADSAAAVAAAAGVLVALPAQRLVLRPAPHRVVLRAVDSADDEALLPVVMGLRPQRLHLPRPRLRLRRLRLPPLRLLPRPLHLQRRERQPLQKTAST